MNEKPCNDKTCDVFATCNEGKGLGDYRRTCHRYQRYLGQQEGYAKGAWDVVGYLRVRRTPMLEPLADKQPIREHFDMTMLALEKWLTSRGIERKGE